MKISVIATLGTSPPVITEFLQYVDRALGQRVSDLSLLITKEPQVLEGLELVKVAAKRRYPHTHVHVFKLPFTDISSDEESLGFVRRASELLREQRRHQPSRVYLCIAGGRKDMCTNLALLAQYFEVNGIFHVIAHDVKAFNELLERLRAYIGGLAKAEDKESYYFKYAEKFDELMYPPLDSYTVIRLPVLPYPREVLKAMTGLSGLKGAVGSRELERKLPADVVEGLNKLGIIRITTKRTVYVTEEGRRLLHALRGP